MLRLVLAVGVLAVARACTDGVDNIIPLKDCAEKSEFAHLTNLQIQSYDKNMKPSCKKNLKGEMEGEVLLPGALRIVKGNVHISKPVHLEGNAKLFLTLHKLNGWLIHKVCTKGKSNWLLIPDKVCQMDFCSTLGEEFCVILDKGGDLDIKDLPPEAAGVIKLPELTGILAPIKTILKGDWEISGQIQYQGKEEACILNADIPFD